MTPLAVGTENMAVHGKRAADGRLELTFGVVETGAGLRTQLRSSVQVPPLRVIRPFGLPGGGALVHLHNVSGGVLGGDRLHTDLHLEPQTHVQVTTTGATRIYRHRPEEPCAAQVTCCHIGRDALLEVLPDPLIPYAGARFRQVTSYHLEDGAGLLAWELVTPGREAHGERFAYDLLELHTTVSTADLPLAIERLRLEPARRPLDSPLRLGRYGSFATLYACRAGWPQAVWAELEQQLGELAAAHSCAGECVWGVSTLPAHGIVVRGLACTQRVLARGLPRFWSAARRCLYGMDGVLPRKLY
jgi:urease accessory protein